MTLGEEHRPTWKRPSYTFNLRTLLVLITLIGFVLAIYEPITLHWKAAHFSKIKRRSLFTRDHPGELTYDINGEKNAILVEVEQVRIVLLERTRLGGTSGFFPVQGDVPRRGGDASPAGEVYFSYSYANGKTKCIAHEFPFTCDAETIEIQNQTFDHAIPTVVLVNEEHRILHTYFPQP